MYLVNWWRFWFIVTGDFANCFYDETGRDIEDGRLTWLIVNAYQRATSAQKQALEQSYGSSENGKVDIVRQVISIPPPHTYIQYNSKSLLGIIEILILRFPFL